MFAVALACLGLIVATTLVHYEVLTRLSTRLEGQRGPQRICLVTAVLGCFAAHAIEVLLYAVAYWALVGLGGIGTLGGGSAPDLSAALYFSVETYTSLGFGDVVPGGPLRLLAGTEALNGLLLIAWSASFLYVEMERHWRRR